MREYKNLISNFISLLTIQFGNFILPLVSFPWLVKSLGVSGFGLLIFTQTVISYLELIVDFGFKNSATRDVSLNCKNKDKINLIFSTVLILKSIIFLICFVILLIVMFFFDLSDGNEYLFLISFLTLIGSVLFPVWLFQGMESMKVITFLSLAVRSIFVSLLFVFVHSHEDISNAALIFSLSSIFTGIIGVWIAFFTFKLKFVIPDFEYLKHTINDSYHFFIAKIASAIYGSSNNIILGLTLGNEAVGIYGIASKLYFSLIRGYQPIANALYPYISRTKNITLFKKVFYVVICLNLIFISVLFYFSPQIIEMIAGDDALSSIIIFRVFVVAMFFTAISVLIAYPFLAAIGYKKQANKSSIVAVIFYFAMLSFLYTFDGISLISMAFLVLLTEVFVVVFLLKTIVVNKLWK